MYIRRVLTGLRKENKMNLRSRKKYLKRWFLIPVISWLEFESKIIGGLTNKSIILFWKKKKYFTILFSEKKFYSKSVYSALYVQHLHVHWVPFAAI